MDPVTITFPGFKNLCLAFRKICQGKFSGGVTLSNDYVIVFPMNSSDKRFSRTIYSPEMTNGRASSEDINQALSLFELALSRDISTSEMIKSFCWRFLLPLILLMMFTANYMLRRPEVIWSCFAAYCVVGIIYLFTSKNAQTKKAKAESQGILDFVQPGYLKGGLRWRIPEESYDRIELIKEYRENETISAPPTVKTNNNQYEPPQNVV